MKSLFVILFITSYVGTGMFGVFGMHTQADMSIQGHDMTPSNCIAVTAKGTDCPKEANLIDFAGFHIDAFRSFSLATLEENISVLLLAPVLLIAGVGLGSLPGNYLSPPQLNFAYSRYGVEQFSSSPKQQLLRWLALHENSPAIS